MVSRLYCRLSRQGGLHGLGHDWEVSKGKDRKS